LGIIIKALYKKSIKWLLKLAVGFILLSLAWVLIYKYLPIPYTPLMVIRYFEAEADFKLRHQWVKLEKINPRLQLAVISAEDQNFYSHYGFDFQAIKSALLHNNRSKSLRGGSTISQQTAKNVFLWQQRSWLRKGLEAWFTLLIELCWSKTRILEVYLNSIEMGKGVFGAQAAANYWFNKPARSLTREQAAAIAAILPNPRKYSARSSTAYIRKKKAWIIRQMKNAG
jgi:monofunctional biosynthetic peptidoglycan transglycosylase